MYLDELLMAKVCIVLAPMRNGTSVFTRCLFSHPDTYGMTNTVTKMKNAGASISSFVPLMKVFACTEPQTPLDGWGYNCKMVVDRSHIPDGERFWSRLDGSGFKIIVIIRDPREVILSVLKWQTRPRRNPKGLPPKKFVAGFMGNWMQAANAYLTLSPKNDCHLVVHEKISNDPTGEGKNLCRWLEIDEECAEKCFAPYKPASERRLENDAFKPHITQEIKQKARRLGYEFK